MFHTTRRKSARLLIAAALVLPASGALADRIDGDWCNPEGKHLSIKGNEIVTPGGVTMAGNYSRHAFTYAIPAGEGANGAQMLLQLLNEETMQARTDGVSGPAVTWKRCQHTS